MLTGKWMKRMKELGDIMSLLNEREKDILIFV